MAIEIVASGRYAAEQATAQGQGPTRRRGPTELTVGRGIGVLSHINFAVSWGQSVRRFYVTDEAEIRDLARVLAHAIGTELAADEYGDPYEDDEDDEDDES